MLNRKLKVDAFENVLANLQSENNNESNENLSKGNSPEKASISSLEAKSKKSRARVQ